jgi:hypothetical protein
LAEHERGLTSIQLAKLMHNDLRKKLLFELQQEGKIKTQKAVLDSGRISFVYVLNKKSERHHHR